MTKTPIPPVINPTEDIVVWLERLMGQTGTIEDHLGGFRIKIHHASMFPWDEVLKALLYRDFKVSVTRHKADLFIEAKP